MNFILVRHGKTQGNIERRYIGCGTDEPLLEEEKKRLRQKGYPIAERVFVSPMLRCIETAEEIYPDSEITVVPDLRECDFGAFENHTYEELKDCPEYQAWLDSGGELAFPDGESRSSFSMRCVQAFENAIAGLEDGCYAFVVHGGTIMAIMEKYAVPKGEYYTFQEGNGNGYILNSDGSYRRIDAFVEL